MPKEEPLLSSRFEEALVYATRLHAQQLRKGTRIPYASHLLIVTGTVLENGGDEDEAIAALLHDAVEDQGGKETLREIGSRFGERVAEMVDACSDTDEIPKPPWRTRKEAYLAHLATASPSVHLISCADKLHNARAILRDYRRRGESLWERFNADRDEIFWYYRSLADIFREVGPAPLNDELDRTVRALERLRVERTGK